MDKPRPRPALTRDTTKAVTPGTRVLAPVHDDSLRRSSAAHWQRVPEEEQVLLQEEKGQTAMTAKLKRLKDQVMVITGASSGIGLTTARLAAKEGARLVLGAPSGTARAE